MSVQSEIRDGLRCAVCEAPFGADQHPSRYVREQDVMVHDGCWEG